MPNFTLRPARPNDAAFMFRVRNDPVTRAACISADPVSWETHVRWFAATLARKDRRLFIGETDGMPVSDIRLDYSPDGVEANWEVAPESRRRGFGAITLIEAMKIETRRPFIANIKPDNYASIAVAANAGLVRSGDADGLVIFMSPSSR